MEYRLIPLDKRLGVRSIGIGETLRRAIAKLFMRVAGYQAKTDYGSLQLCAYLKDGIKGVTHAVAQRWRERNTTDPEGGG